mmetsp:Transcript_38707/g.60372  ORF Transcript_38707/g.60372 Transcript_38707/m.60372 type:complete len:285 (-) Transcript_38707:105-959(-)
MGSSGAAMAKTGVTTSMALLARKIAIGPAVGSRELYAQSVRRPRAGILGRLAVSKRKFSTETAMQPEISLLMANLAGIVPGSKILDPCCGSCSLLLCASFILSGQCETVGVDSDPTILESKGQIIADFEDFKLPAPHVYLGDLSDQLPDKVRLGRFGAIITDPPYNMRAAMHTDTTTESSLVRWRSEDSAKGASETSTEDIVADILSLADASLGVGSRLVYFHPIRAGQVHSSELSALLSSQGNATLVQPPETEFRFRNLRMLVAIPQSFSPTFKRWLVVLEKA